MTTVTEFAVFSCHLARALDAPPHLASGRWGRVMKRRDPTVLCRDLARIVGHDGSDNLRVIVDCALADNPRVTLRTLVRIVRDARRDAAAEGE